MKTLSFLNLEVGRARKPNLLLVDTERDGIVFGPGIHLLAAPNGFGKTSLLQTLAGVLPARKGEIRWGEHELKPEQDLLYLSEYLRFPKFIYPSEWVEFVAGRTESSKYDPTALEGWVNRLRLSQQKKNYLGRMSQGERRKVTLLAAEVSSRPVLLLDEPMDGLDLLAIAGARELLRHWKKRGRCVVIVAHQAAEILDLADQILLIQNEKIKSLSSVFPTATYPPTAEEFREKVLSFYSSLV